MSQRWSRIVKTPVGIVGLGLLALIVLLGCIGCTTSAGTQDTDESEDSPVTLITRREGENDSIWSTGRGHLRVEAGCILLKGQLVVFPFGTTLTDGSTSLQISADDEPIPLDGSAEVDVTGSEVPLGEDSDWDQAMDAVNLARWSDCRRRVGISEYADWWMVGQLRVVGDG